MSRAMPNNAISDISQSQRERLAHIDFRLLFLGSMQRSDLIQRFGMKEAAATRDIALYKKFAPENLTYDTKARSYFYQTGFNPVFNYTPENALAALSRGYGDDYTGSTGQPMIPCETPTQLNRMALSSLAVLTRAIYQKQVVNVTYYSLSSGISEREIVPFALVDTGQRWHVRAFDRKQARFTDFVINRIKNPAAIESRIDENETRQADNQWNRIVDLSIVPHPKLSHPETIAMEYNMENNELHIQVRAAVAGYLLRRWNIDCSENHRLTGDEYHLWLKNYPTLYGVENLVIAPGYQ
jgi:hypothetical protein